MAGRRRYLCVGCRDSDKWLDIDAPDSVRTGCKHCERINTHVAYHTSAFYEMIVQRRQLPSGGETA
jgi:hypothetical protein